MKVRKSINGTYFIKKGMTSVMEENGIPVPVTVLLRVKNSIIGKKENKSICVFEGCSGRFNKPQIGSISKYTENFPKKGFIKEISIENQETEIPLTYFEKGNFIDVSGVTKGKGFQGCVKRHGFKSGRASHGCSLAHRTPGSTGMRHLPSKTIKGRRMPGHMGAKLRTQQNLEVVRLVLEHDALLVKGSVPGPKNSLIFVKKAVKNAI